MQDAGLFELAVPGDAVEPGTALSGEVIVTGPGEVRGVALELVRGEQSARTSQPTIATVASARLVGATTLEPGQRFAFSVTLPASAQPGFRTPHGVVEWFVRARADVFGPDIVTERPITVRPSGVAPSAAQLGALGAATAAMSRADKPVNVMLGVVFAGLGVLFAGLGLVWAANPPEAWGESGNGGLLAFTFGLALLLLGCGGLVLRQQRAASIEGVTVALDLAGYWPGGVITASTSNSGTRSLTIGYQCVEIVKRDSGAGEHRSITYPQHVLHEDWRPLPAGEGQVRFSVPADVPASYAGDAVSVDHRVVIVPAGKERSVRNRARLRTDVVVRPRVE